jgi:hypothetical protein
VAALCFASKAKQNTIPPLLHQPANRYYTGILLEYSGFFMPLDAFGLENSVSVSL